MSTKASLMEHDNVLGLLEAKAITASLHLTHPELGRRIDHALRPSAGGDLVLLLPLRVAELNHLLRGESVGRLVDRDRRLELVLVEQSGPGTLGIR